MPIPAWVGPTIEGGSSIIGALVGADAQSDAINSQIAANNANLLRDDRRAFLQRILASRLLDAQLAPTTNVRGDRTVYIPGVGWQTIPSEMTEQITRAGDQAQETRLTRDEVVRNEERQRGLARRGEEGRTANSLLNRLQDRIRNPQFTPESIYADQSRQFTTQTNRAFDDIANVVARSANRGAVGGEGALRGLARERANQLAAGAPTRSGARETALRLNQAGEAGDANLYNVLASRATNTGEVPFTPPLLAQNLSSQLTSQKNTLPLGASVYGKMFATKGGTVQPNPVDYSNAGLIQSVGTGLGGLFDLLSQRQQPDKRRPGNSQQEFGKER